MSDDTEFTGNGKIILPDGDLWEGIFVNGLLNGKGILTSSQGVYEGDFDCNVFHGIGKWTCADGKVYEGKWENGEFLR